MTVLTLILKTIACCVACFGLWKWLIRLRRGTGAFGMIVAAGFVMRAVAGEILFWVSYLKLPFLRPMQVGEGFWFFALDAIGYMQFGNRAAAQGLHGFLHIPRYVASILFIQLVALCSVLFGGPASLGILINCASYLAMATVVAHLAKRCGSTRAASISMAFLTFMPGGFLWSLQPLKDIFFGAVIAALVVVAVSWDDAVRRDARWSVMASIGIVALSLMWIIAGIRWYVALAFMLATPFLAMAETLVTKRRVAAIGSAALAFVAFSQEIVLATEPQPPPIVARLRLSFHSAGLQQGSTSTLESARADFATVDGGTAIKAGPLLRRGSEHDDVDRYMTQPRLVRLSARKQATLRQQMLAAPATPIRKLIAGTAAMILPRFVAQATGLIRIGGGRGLWLFAETDTILLDVLLAGVVIVSVQYLRKMHWRPAPAFVFVAVSCALLAAPLAFSVTNFGTMFRLRNTLIVELALLPLLRTSEDHPDDPAPIRE